MALAMLGLSAPLPAQGLSDRDRQQGAALHQQVLQQFGGAYSGPQVPYVVRVGRRIAAQSGVAARPEDYTVTVLNSTVPNAFALPGGYIYVTRGLMAMMNSEAELASVLGHEVGHVAAHHAQKRQNRAAIGSIFGAVVGAVTGSGTLGSVAGSAGQLWTLGYSRAQEYEADALGVRYLVQAGYDPYAAAAMLDSLERETELQARLKGQTTGNTPTWLSTHPSTPDRVRRAADLARRTGIAPAARPTNRAAYLAAIDGLTYGDDASQGFVDGRGFRHPALRLAFDAPLGFSLVNGRDTVTGRGPNGAQLIFAGGAIAPGQSLEAYNAAVWQGMTRGRIDRADGRALTVNGLRGYTSFTRVPTSGGGQVDVSVTSYRWIGNQAFHLITLAPSGQDPGFDALLGSVRRLSDAEAGRLRARRIEVVAVRPGDTAQSLARRMAFSDAPLERFRALNRIGPDTRLQPGDKVKLVVYAGA